MRLRQTYKLFKHPIRQAEDFSGLCEKVLGQNARNVPTPTVYDARQETEEAFEVLLEKLMRLFKQSQENGKSFSICGTYDPTSVELVKQYR